MSSTLTVQRLMWSTVVAYHSVVLLLRYLGSVHTAHDTVRQRWMPWRTMSDDTGRNDIGWRRLTTFTCKLPCCAGVQYDIIQHRTTLMQKLNQVHCTPAQHGNFCVRNWTKFNFCVSVVAATYDIVQYVNSAVKSMCSISYDMVRRRPMSCAVWTPL